MRTGRQDVADDDIAVGMAIAVVVSAVLVVVAAEFTAWKRSQALLVRIGSRSRSLIQRLGECIPDASH